MSFGSLSLAVGALLLAFESRMPFDGLLFGYLFLAMGGPFTYISSLQLSNAFPRHSGFVLVLLTGAFDASSALFLIYRIIYERTDRAFSRQRFLLVYLLVPVAIMLLQLILMPAQSYKTVGELVEELEAPLYTADPGPMIKSTRRRPCCKRRRGSSGRTRSRASSRTCSGRPRQMSKRGAKSASTTVAIALVAWGSCWCSMELNT